MTLNNNPWSFLVLLELFIKNNNQEKAEKFIELIEKINLDEQSANFKFEQLKNKLIELKNTNSAWNEPVEEDFDEKFYYEKYEDIRNWYVEDESKTLRQRMFHHYFLYGKKEGRYKKNINTNEINYIFLKVKNGLANRLRCLSSFYNYAKTFDKKLFVCWEPGMGWGSEHFLDLFENIDDINFISSFEYEQFSKEHPNIEQFIRQKPPIYYTFDIAGGELLQIIENKSFCYQGDSALEYFLPKNIESKYLFFDKLVPKKNIKSKIERITSIFDQNTIGVHIRKGDARNSPWKYFYELSNDDFFIKEMNREIDNNKNSNFYLSTDCEKTQNKFLEMFDDKIICLNKKFVESVDHEKPKYGQEDALIDLFCLSSTNKIIGTYWSSFSTLSANLKNKPIVLSQNHIGVSKNLSIKNKENISIVCAAKNRTQQLLVSLNSWLNIPQINNIIIVDYSSDEPIEPKIKHLSDKINIVRVENQKFFNISKAYNMGFKNAPEGFILKLDVDYIMSPYLNFFEIYDLENNEFFTGSWKDLYFENNGFLRHLNGLLFIRKKDFFMVDGYDENLENYGFEDCDLYLRLERKGIKRRYLNHKFISVFHIPHDNYYRTVNYENKDLNESIKKNIDICWKKNNEGKL